MADQTYRSGLDRYDRDRGYGRQAEQFDAADYSWRDDEREYGQMQGWREEDYGQFGPAGQSYSREAARDWSRDPRYARRSELRPGARYASPRYGTERTFDRGNVYGAGSQLAANHGEWREPHGVSPGRAHRDYRNERGWFDRAADSVASLFGDDDATRRRERDYRGQGPSGYVRSDERIMEDACDRLTDDWGVDARQISVTVSNGEITLDGSVPSRQQKRRAEDVIDELSGVKNVQNNLRVQVPAAWDRNGRGDAETTGTI